MWFRPKFIPIVSITFMLLAILPRTSYFTTAFSAQSKLSIGIPIVGRNRLRMMSNLLSGNMFVSVEDCLDVFKKECNKKKADVNQGDNYPRTIFIDGSWHLSPDRHGRSEYEKGPRIRGARFFDIDDVSAKGDNLNPKSLPHMMPPKKLFEATMDALNIKNSDHIVIYGTKGCMTTARAWYTMRAMGHAYQRVHLMQGSLEEWELKGGAVDTNSIQALKSDDLDLTKETMYKAHDAENIVDMEEVLKVVNEGKNSDSIIIDARSEARFRAEAPEPRPGARLGHMPSSYNVPFIDLLVESDVSKFRSIEELKEVFEKADIDVNTDKNIICSCGSGVTACVVASALAQIGRDSKKTFIYDGSWVEWGFDPDTPIVS